MNLVKDNELRLVEVTVENFVYGLDGTKRDRFEFYLVTKSNAYIEA